MLYLCKVCIRVLSYLYYPNCVNIGWFVKECLTNRGCQFTLFDQMKYN